MPFISSPDLNPSENITQLNLNQITIEQLLSSTGRHHLTFKATYNGESVFFRKPNDKTFVDSSIKEAQAAFNLYPKLPAINQELEKNKSPVRFFIAKPLAMVYKDGQFEGSLHQFMDFDGFTSIHYDSLSDYSQLEGFELILNRWQEILKMTDFQSANKQIKAWLAKDKQYLKEHNPDSSLEQSAHQSSKYILNSLLTEKNLAGIQSEGENIKEMQKRFDEVSIMKAFNSARPLIEKQGIILDTFGTDNIRARKNPDGTIDVFLSDYTFNSKK